ncbi:hypothetical protein [Bacillus salipaludis]|uniref:Uncharacterized protein n=1 Tax=Bacillus salipaludis TaxID=2547811 RepID=A0ABW8RJS3_9BACI
MSIGVKLKDIIDFCVIFVRTFVLLVNNNKGGVLGQISEKTLLRKI